VFVTGGQILAVNIFYWFLVYAGLSLSICSSAVIKGPKLLFNVLHAGRYCVYSLKCTYCLCVPCLYCATGQVI